MRIASLSLHWPRTRDSGVGKKLDRQIRFWKADGHAASLFMHTSRHDPSSALVPGEVIPYTMGRRPATEFNRIKATVQLIQAVRAYQPDVIYLRLGMYVYPLHQLKGIAPLVAEANTNDLKQHRELGSVFVLYNRLTRGLLLSRLHGLVTVSHELAELAAFAKFKKPTCVIANGIDLQSVVPLPAPANPIPRLVFIGNPGYLWHGADKLVTLARQNPDIQIEVIGYDRLMGIDSVPDNLQLHGFLSDVEYKKILATADVAISSLGLHRIGLREASPLKSRECLALGLPLVVAYVDTDLHSLDCDFVLRIPNTEDNMITHGREIRNFAIRMRGRRVEREKIASIDQASKESKRIGFFREIISQKK